MAKGKKTGGRDFKPGSSGNPIGYSTVPPDLREARKLNKIEFDRIVNRFLEMNRIDLGAVTKDPKTSTLDLLVASIVHKAIVQGDEKRLSFLLDRIIGRVKERVEVTGVNDSPLLLDTRIGMIQKMYASQKGIEAIKVFEEALCEQKQIESNGMVEPRNSGEHIDTRKI